MYDITTKDNNTLSEIPKSDIEKQMCRNIESLQVGDYFLRGKDLLRVTEIFTKQDGERIVRYGIMWDLENDDFSKSYGSDNIIYFIKRYGEFFIADPYELYRNAVGFINGTYTPDIPSDISEDSDSQECTALAAKSSVQMLVTSAQEKKLFMRRLSELEKMANYHKGVLEARMRNQIQKLTESFQKIRKQFVVIQKAIGMLELYLGDEHCILQFANGEVAAEGEPLTIHQQILYMDEECGICEDGGIDSNNIGEFDDWLIKSNHLDRILPDKKGIVALKPRRFIKEYGDAGYDAQMRVWNRHTYFLFRNGDNLYRIDSENIEVSERMFPLRLELQKLYDDLDGMDRTTEEERIKERIQAENEKYYRIILFLQGILDHTEILNPIPQGINLFFPETYSDFVKLVYDDEAAITDGHISYNEWLAQTNKEVKRGSRIVFIEPTCREIGWHIGDKQYYANHHLLKWYNNEYSLPDFPSDGIYTIEDIEKDGEKKLGFKYLPRNRNFYSDEKRKNKISFILCSEDKYINYDGVSLDEVEYFIESRLERKNYINILPVMLQIRRQLKKEQEQEDAFKLMLQGELIKNKIEVARANDIISEAVNWWKYKNIWKRPIAKDDEKALRMIKARVLRLIK